MIYLIITTLMGLCSPSRTPINNAQITVQVTDNGDEEGGETGTVRPPIPPLPIPVPPIWPLPIPPMLP